MSFNWNNSLFKWSTSHSPHVLQHVRPNSAFSATWQSLLRHHFCTLKSILHFHGEISHVWSMALGVPCEVFCSNRHFHIRLHCSIRTFGGVTAWWFRNHPRIYAIPRQLITSRFGQFWDSCRTAVDGGILRAFTLFSACRQFRSIIGWLLSSHLVSVQYIIGIIGAHVMRWCQGPHQS